MSPIESLDGDGSPSCAGVLDWSRARNQRFRLPSAGHQRPLCSEVKQAWLGGKQFKVLKHGKLFLDPKRDFHNGNCKV
jgi:hypothetical protein